MSLMAKTLVDVARCRGHTGCGEQSGQSMMVSELGGSRYFYTGVVELGCDRGAAGRGECLLRFASLMAESADSKNIKVAVTSRKSHFSGDRRSPFQLGRAVLERCCEFDRQFQKTQGKAHEGGQAGKVSRGRTEHIRSSERTGKPHKDNNN